MILLLLMNVVVLSSAFLLTYKAISFANSVDSILALFLIYLSLIIASELMLGILGALYLENVILFHLIILFVIWFITRKQKFSFNLREINIANLWSEFSENKVLLFLYSPILVFGLGKILINLIHPPFGWDDLNYHFTFPVEWLKRGNLDIPITINDDPAPSYYPINGSLWYLWFILPLKSVFIADLGQVPFFALAIISLYNLSRKIGVSRQYSLYASGLFFIIPNFFKQLEIAYVDVMVAALFLAGLNFLFDPNEKLSFKRALVFSISLGLFLGVKSVALPYSLLLVTLFFYLCIKNRKEAGIHLPIFILIIFFLGGYSYLRNFLDTGNPLYPLDYKIFGRLIFKGVVDMQTWRAHFLITDYSLSKVLFHEGLGLQTVLFVLPAIFVSLPAVVFKKRKGINFTLVYLAVIPALLYMIYRYLIPLANVRYLYALMGLAMVLAFYSAKLFNMPARILKILVAICALDSIFKLASDEELIISAMLAFALFALLWFLIKKGIWLRIKPRIIILFIMIFTLGLIWLEGDYRRNEYARYIKMEDYSGFWPDATRAWEWLNKNTNGDNVAYVGRPVPFPLYGNNFKNNVYYVSINKTDPVKLHYFKNSRYLWGYDFISLQNNLQEKNNYRGGADYSIWLSNLLRRNTGYLFIYSLHQTERLIFPVEDQWANAHPEIFNPVFINETVHIYRIKR